jgi:ribonuclease HII
VKAPARPHFRFEREAIRNGFALIAGVDEVGRGPLAGPVGVAAVILDPGNVPKGIDDSKALPAARREALCEAIYASAIAVAIVFANAEEVDAFNIRGATLRAMARAIAALAPSADFVLIDGRDVPDGIACPARAIIDGDALSLSIAAASIVAKTVRDAAMRRLDREFPAYGFADHVGYATERHRAALARHGPCPHHRRSFRLT